MSPFIAQTSTDDARAQLLRCLFLRLDETGVQYAVLRNWSGLPEQLEAADLDVVVDPDQRRAFCRILEEEAVGLGWRRYFRFRDARLEQHAFARKADESVAVLRVDVFSRIEVYGVRLLEAALVLSRRQRWRGVYKASETCELLDKVLYHTCVNRPLDRKYAARFARITRRHESEIRLLLRHAFGTRTATRICDGLLHSRSDAVVFPWWRRAVNLAVLFSKSPLRNAVGVARFLAYRVLSLARPNGVVVVIALGEECDVDLSHVVSNAREQVEALFRVGDRNVVEISFAGESRACQLRAWVRTASRYLSTIRPALVRREGVLVIAVGVSSAAMAGEVNGSIRRALNTILRPAFVYTAAHTFNDVRPFILSGLLRARFSRHLSPNQEPP